MSCRCHHPVENINPRNEGLCVKCSKKIAEPEWDSSDKTLGDFFERLAESSFPAYSTSNEKDRRKHIPQSFFHFYRQCSGRERAGRKKFGYQYLVRSNPREAQEEAADLANYLHFECLRRRRLGQDEEADIALTGAMYAFKAWDAARRMTLHDYPSISGGAETETQPVATPHN